jgi:hypothetical protein
MTSPPKVSAAAIAAAVLPMPVGPQMTRTGGFEEMSGLDAPIVSIRSRSETGNCGLKLETGNWKLGIR